MPQGQYYSMTFQFMREAAAFVAALSRFLDSPRASGSQRELAEIWSRVSAHDHHVELYLNGPTKAAAAEAFAPLPLMHLCSSRSIFRQPPHPRWTPPATLGRRRGRARPDLSVILNRPYFGRS